MSLELSHIEEEYLEAIWRIERRNTVVKTGDLSHRLNVTMGTASNMIDHLEHKGLLGHKHYKGLKLTKKGKEAATMIVRRHRLGERLLTDLLHLDWTRVHDASCKLEHSLSEEVTEAIDATLGRPKTCPHGNPIPSKDGEVSEDEALALSELEVGANASVRRVVEEKTELLQYLSTLGLKFGAKVTVLGKAPFNGPLLIKVGAASHALSRDIADLILVKKEPSSEEA
jgi:DtxR family Mn-dependent transcriptional regulator